MLDKLNNELTFLNQTKTKDRSQVTSKISFVGIGLDTNCTVKGVEFGPDAIRFVSKRYSNADGSSQPIKVYNPDKGYILDGITIEDTGNIKLNKDLGISEKIINEEIRKILHCNSIPLIVGGDHFISFPIISAYKQKITVIHLDAHSDYLDEKVTCPHGSVMREVGTLENVKRIIHCGVRGNLNSGPAIKDSKNRGNVIITCSELIKEGINKLLKYIEKDEPVYLSIDIDFLDPSIAPATGYPEPEGVSYSFAKDIINDIATKSSIIGIDITEYNPSLDNNFITGVHITNLILETLSVIDRKHKAI